jgi:hypothetical protein
MGTSRRNKAPARWLLLGISGLAGAGFLGAVLSAARPQNSSAIDKAAQTERLAEIVATQAPSSPSSRAAAPIAAPVQSSSISSQSSSARSSSSATVATARPRLRTRGS